ncbi:hypothetical protein K9B32_16385 [Rhizobium sp. 3T7]|uniref:hypothetical protein n=1 Tax=Rhizobium sp. 3T7 TaxID=2874922 RepID=UPI001CCDF3C8|nr:hypothetical protein [Rhizobium sp. 3T7]MBZ9791684.1 hypothetical protein [Rhizobium sp. 3T7]
MVFARLRKSRRPLWIGVAVVGVAALVVSLRLGAAGPWSQSEMILSGLWTPATPGDAPAEIVLPKSWTRMLRDLYALQRSTDREHAACLDVVVGSPMPYKVQGAWNVADDPTVGREWTTGEIQEGEKSFVMLKNEETGCGAAHVALAHSHSADDSYDAPSDIDLETLLSTAALKASLTISFDRVCAIVKTGASSEKFVPKVRADYAVAMSSEYFPTLRSGKSWSWYDALAAARSAAAYAAERAATVLYCGKIDAPLARVAAANPDLGDPLFILETKALLVAGQHMSAGPELNFDFVPERDDTYVRFVRDIPWLASADAEAVAAGPPGQGYAAMVGAMGRSAVMPMFYGFAGPDPRFQEGRYFELACLHDDEASSWSCIVADVQGRGKRALRTFAAFYDPKIPEWEIVSADKGGYRTRSLEADGTTYTGSCDYGFAIRCMASGRGTLETRLYRFEGEFSEGKPFGRGVYTQLQTGESWNVVKKQDSGFERVVGGDPDEKSVDAVVAKP